MTLLLSSLLMTSFAFANTERVNCDSIRGTNRSLLLIIVDSDLKQVRVLTAARHFVLVPQKINTQNNPDFTFYTVLGQPSILQVENKVLENNGGLVKFSGDEFSCF